MNLSCEACKTREPLTKIEHTPPADMSKCPSLFCDHCDLEMDYFAVGGVIRVDLCDDCIGEALKP